MFQEFVFCYKTHGIFSYCLHEKQCILRKDYCEGVSETSSTFCQRLSPYFYVLSQRFLPQLCSKEYFENENLVDELLMLQKKSKGFPQAFHMFLFSIFSLQSQLELCLFLCVIS